MNNFKKIKHETIFNKTGKWFCFSILIIPFIVWLISYVGANYYSIELAFVATDRNGVKTFTTDYFKQFFVEIFAPDTILNVALRNTMKYWMLGIVKSFLCVFISYFLFKKILFSKTYMVLMFLPSMIAGTVYITIFKNLFVTYGPIWSFLFDNFGIDMQYPFSSDKLATPVILFYTMWSGFGAGLLIYVGVMNRIPGEVLEAAKLDGCGWFREFRSIIFPFTWSTFATFFITSFTGIFMSTGPILLFTGTNEYFKTFTLNFYIYVQVLSGQFNYASAISVVICVVTIPIVIIARRVMNKFQEDLQF